MNEFVYWEEILHYLTTPLFSLGETPISVATIFKLVAIMVVVAIAARYLRRLVQAKLLARTKMTPGLQYAISRIAGYVVILLGFIVGLQTIGINLNSLAVVLGALGIGIGLGLQNIVNNFLSGLILLSDRSIQVGDRIEVGNTSGKVIKIGARATSILTNDDIVIIVPNAEFVTEKVINWSYGVDQRVRLRMPVGVSYNSDPNLVEKLLLEVAKENKGVLSEPPSSAIITGFGESSIDFELRVWTMDLIHRPGYLKSSLYFDIWEKFKANGIEIPFPQRDVHIKTSGKPQEQA
jgi:small-conductance mechanosensitive channel